MAGHRSLPFSSSGGNDNGDGDGDALEAALESHAALAEAVAAAVPAGVAALETAAAKEWQDDCVLSGKTAPFCACLYLRAELVDGQRDADLDLPEQFSEYCACLTDYKFYHQAPSTFTTWPFAIGRYTAGDEVVPFRPRSVCECGFDMPLLPRADSCASSAAVTALVGVYAVIAILICGTVLWGCGRGPEPEASARLARLRAAKAPRCGSDRDRLLGRENAKHNAFFY